MFFFGIFNEVEKVFFIFNFFGNILLSGSSEFIVLGSYFVVGKDFINIVFIMLVI